MEAWLTAPWFMLAPVNLVTLSLSLILINIAAALLMIVALERWGGLRPLHALVASLFFVLPPPIVAGDLVSVSGGNVEPFLYVVILWMLRDRPLWFGAVLAVGFLQREFTAYAVPALLAVDLAGRRRFTRDTIRKWLLAFVMFAAVWESVQALQPYADLMGPGTRGQLLGGFAGSQMGNLLRRMEMTPSEILPRMEGMIRLHLPRLLGAIAYEDHVPRARPLVAWLLVAAFAAAAGRLVALVWRAARSSKLADLRQAAFGWYLLTVGLLAAAVYVGTRPVTEEYARYGLLGLLAPVGLAAVLMAIDRNVWARRATIAGVLLWAAMSAADSVQLYSRYAGGKPSDLRILADALVARDVRAAYAPYWTAYAVTFMAGERVKVASTDFVRIQEYQSFALSRPDVVDIREQPCAGGERIARWYLCRQSGNR
jgi:hypothetical protein